MRLSRTISVGAVLLCLLVDGVFASDCVTVDGPSVRPADLVLFLEQTQNLPLDRILTATPNPGTRRWISAAEARLWGFPLRLEFQDHGVCVERALKPIQADDVKKELQAALQSVRGEARLVGITSIQPGSAPAGKLNLPLSGLQQLPVERGVCSFLWRGSIEYDERRLTPIKILGRYQAETIRYVAKRDLLAGDVLGPGDFEKALEAGCPHGAAAAEPPEGSVMRRALRSGEAIEPSMLKGPAVVEEGSAVRVLASAGGALVSVEAIAEHAGRRGESVFVRNSASGKRIRVLLTGKGEASAIVVGAAR